MAIEFHCNFCGKLVKAPDEAGGKKGKCPACQNVLYVPMPEGAVDEFDLAPIDEAEERRRRQMEAQALAAERALLKEKQVPPEGATPTTRSEIDLPVPPAPSVSGPATSDDVEFLVIEWVRAMADGDLGDADRSMMLLQKDKAASKQAVQKVRMAEPPPSALQNVPRPVLNRYFKMLSDQL